MTDTVTEFIGYDQAAEACRELVNSASHPGLGAAALLDISIKLGFIENGREWLEDTLCEVLRRLPQIEAQVRERMQ